MEVIRHKGEELGADYTAFPQVAAAAWCPIPESPGALAPWPTVGPRWSLAAHARLRRPGRCVRDLEDARSVTAWLHYRAFQ